jgi:hypothetical protein
LRCQPDHFTVRQHDDAEPRIFRPAAATELNDAHRSPTGSAEIGGEAGDQPVRIVVGPVDDGSQIALGVEAHAAFLVGVQQRYIRSYISMCATLASRRQHCLDSRIAAAAARPEWRYAR